jgi:hypothetical protein
MTSSNAPAATWAGNSTSTSYAPSPIQLPSLPFLISAPGGPQLREYEHEYLQQAQHGGTRPAHANMPRRAKVLTAAQVRVKRRRERGMQELGRALGVFVAFESASAEDINEDRKNSALW